MQCFRVIADRPEPVPASSGSSGTVGPVGHEEVVHGAAGTLLSKEQSSPLISSREAHK